MIDRDRFTSDDLHDMLKGLCVAHGIFYKPLKLTLEELYMMYEDLEYWDNCGTTDDFEHTYHVYQKEAQYERIN